MDVNADTYTLNIGKRKEGMGGNIWKRKRRGILEEEKMGRKGKEDRRRV